MSTHEGDGRAEGDRRVNESRAKRAGAQRGEAADPSVKGSRGASGSRSTSGRGARPDAAGGASAAGARWKGSGAGVRNGDGSSGRRSRGGPSTRSVSDSSAGRARGPAADRSTAVGRRPAVGGSRPSEPRRGQSGRPAGTVQGDERSVLELPDSVVAGDLDRAARSRLRTLSKDNADAVARHLVMAGHLLDDDPESAYAHVQEAVRRAGRVDVVREAAGITAYRTGRYAEALRELRTARRLNGSNEHVPLMADCERGLGRPERALALAQEHSTDLVGEAKVEMAIVASGARLDLGDADAALAELSAPGVRDAKPPLSWRVDEARAAALAAAGRNDEANALLAVIPEEAFGSEEIELLDLEAEDDSELRGAEDPTGEASPDAGVTERQA